MAPSKMYLAPNGDLHTQKEHVAYLFECAARWAAHPHNNPVRALEVAEMARRCERGEEIYQGTSKKSAQPQK